MKKPIFRSRLATVCLTLVIVLGSPVNAQTASAPATPASASSASEAAPTQAFQTRREAISYAVGVTTARNLVKDGVDIDPLVILKGMQDALDGKRILMTEKEIRSVMSGLVGEMRQKMAVNRKDAEDINRKKGDEFRAAFGKQENVVSLPNGILYKIVKLGSGPKPTPEDDIVVNYRGTLTSGYEFDASAEGKPVILKMTQLITGWREAAKLMPSGSRWTIVVPPQLAYGTRGVGADIGPNETLIFDVELLAINK
jgi:FKBP-type peptidyl-prolyl cis-trans isomerase FklB